MKNILIIKPSSFGDIVQALPVAARLKRAHPEAGIAWLVNSQYARLLDRNPCIDRLLPFERHLWKRARTVPGAMGAFTRLCGELCGARFDTVLDLQGLFRSGLFSLATGAAVRAGFANAREGAPLFYTHRVPVPEKEMHSVERYLLVANALGCTEGGVGFPLGIGRSEEEWAERFLTCGDSPCPRPCVGLSPSARWTTKRWPVEHFAALGDALSKAGATVVIIDGLSGEAAGVASAMKERALVAKNLDDPLKLAALLKRLDVLVTNDTGPMHLAAAVGTPVVALFGPTNPARTGPYGTQHTIICAPVECRPCYSRDCKKDKECMPLIDVETVLKAVEKYP